MKAYGIVGKRYIFSMLPSPPLIARTLIIALVPMLSVGLRDPCEGDLGGTENLVKPSESLGKKLEKLLLMRESWDESFMNGLGVTLIWYVLSARWCSKCFLLIFTTIIRSRYCYYPHSADEKTKVLKVQV